MGKVDRYLMMCKFRIKDKPGDNNEVAPVEPQASNFNLANHYPSVNADPNCTWHMRVLMALP